MLAAAVAVADDAGVAAVSMRKVAERLGVEAMSLYHHVPNKEAVLDGIVDAVVGEISEPPPGAGWREALQHVAASAREVLSRHSWALALIESREAGPAGLRHRDRMLGALLTCGFTPVDAVGAVSVVDSYVYGFVLQEQQLRVRTADDVAQAAGAVPDGGTYPHLQQVAEAYVAAGRDPHDEFARGLDLVLDGVERRLAPP
ncbi:TetR/AcrR family transcriptional regulator [Cellulomonas sp. APG4]|nr:TetR/AcrR family transcriptional regulator [Cellulomonas sp. APG4]